jgi:cytochrome c553
MRVLIGFVAAGIVASIAVVIVTLAGLYDVAATKPHFRFVYWALELGMRRSVQVHAAAIKVPPLGDEAQVIRGFRHFQTGCLVCHSARNLPVHPTVWRMQPEAPDLAEKVSDWSANELFWIVKHGIKMTGMPAWEAQERDDEVWDLVAFLQELPRMTPERLRQMMREDESEAAVRASDGQLIAMAGPPQKAEAACVRCHGFDGAGDPSGAFPRIGGQDASYLHEQLKRYAKGVRPSGVMAPVARALSDEEMRLVAEHYASMQASASSARPASGDPARLQTGAALAAAGAPERGIEACANCHGRAGSGTAAAPALAGQYAGYLSQQLTLWKTGRRRDSDDVMGRIAKRMSEAEIAAVADYFATLPAGDALARE